MTPNKPSKFDRVKAAEIVRDAGGMVVGRTKLQKIGYLLEVAGLGEGFRYEYCYYGPFSEQLSNAIRIAVAFGLVEEDERPTDWGGFYSIYRTTSAVGAAEAGPRAEFIQEAAKAGSIELELAATAAFLHDEGSADPWGETARLKQLKAQEGRLEKAKGVYRTLQTLSEKLNTPTPLPAIA